MLSCVHNRLAHRLTELISSLFLKMTFNSGQAELVETLCSCDCDLHLTASAGKGSDLSPDQLHCLEVQRVWACFLPAVEGVLDSANSVST